ncbi:MAG: tyrosine-type recombinase/integrase [Christensenellales bacterium]
MEQKENPKRKRQKANGDKAFEKQRIFTQLQIWEKRRSESGVECVQPIRDVEQVHEIERRLYERKGQSEKNWRQYMLFELGIYTGLRISDLARLKVSDVRGREVLTLKETKTGKQTNLPLSRKVQGVIRRELKGYPRINISFFLRIEPSRRNGTRKDGKATRSRSTERQRITMSMRFRERSELISRLMPYAPKDIRLSLL